MGLSLCYGLYLSFDHTENNSYIEITDKKHYTYIDISKHFDTIWNDDDRAMVLSTDLIEKFESSLYFVKNELPYFSNSKWKIHLHDLDNMVKSNAPAPFNSIIGEIHTWDLQINKPKKGIYLEAKLSIPGKELKANVVTERIHDRDYAHIRFSDFKTISIHLSFHCRQDRIEDVLLGYVIIASGSDACSCYMVMKKEDVQNSQNTNTDDDIHLYYNRLLSFRDSSYLSLERVKYEKEKLDINRWAGLYKVYSYGGKKGDQKCIKVNWLSIDRYGVARYTNEHLQNLEGRATHIPPNLHFVFTYYDEMQEKQRRSYLIISIGKTTPIINQRYYTGVHLGVSWDSHMPTGKRFILEYVGKEEKLTPAHTHRKINLHSPEYNELDTAVQRLLSGRVKNLLGFLRQKGNIFNLADLKTEWERSIPLGDVFYDSAVQHVKRGAYKDAVTMLFRAVNHGFNDMNKFENEINKDYPLVMEEIRKEKDYAKILAIFNQK
jgi:hypothetical protein